MAALCSKCHLQYAAHRAGHGVFQRVTPAAKTASIEAIDSA
jgi:hypothetical protein